MSSIAGGWLGVLVILTCASACVRDDWTYGVRADANTSEVTADVPAVDASMDTSVDVPAIDAPAIDVPAIDVPATDVPAIDGPAIDVPSIDSPVADAPTLDVPVIDVPVIDVPALDAPADAQVDVPAIDVPVADVRADVPVDVPVADVPALVAPRPIAPVSLGDVTQRRPTLRWQLPAGFDGAVVELCRDRACTMVIETRAVSGTSAQPTADLPPRSVVFWRLRGRRGATTDAAYGPTWLFHVPAVSASTSVDTSANPHCDVNGDGSDDVVVAAKNVSVRSLAQMGAVSVFHGSPSGLAATADRVLESPGLSGGFAFGFSVANAGDVNGDGYADLIVGAIGGSPRGLGLAGEAYVFHGSASGVAATAARVLGGSARGSEFGQSVAGVGDVNGDGYADVVVGEPYADPGGNVEAGSASVFLGSAGGVVTDAARVFNGDAAGDLFGQRVAGAGDVNGDGYDDVIIGAPYATVGGRTHTGAASVFLGGASGLTTTPRVIAGVAADDLLGGGVAGAGDVNGDGYGDVVVGASRASPGGLGAAGTASVFHGGAAGLSAGAIRVLTGAAGDLLGSAVAGAGDVNGDGFGDLAVGAQSGSVQVFHGSSTGVVATTARVLTGTNWNNLSLAGAGDVNRDGYDDLIVGTPNTNSASRNFDGSAHVFIGSASGVAATSTQVYVGAADGDLFGGAVASWSAWPRPGWFGRRRT